MPVIQRFMEAGGPLMWPLLVCSILLGAVIFERLCVIVLRHRLLGLPTHYTRLIAHRRVLPFFTDVPPSIGLLGTVVGVIQSFQLAGGRVNADAVGNGLGVACITTVFGLSIAIVASVAGYLGDWMVNDSRPIDPAALAGEPVTAGASSGVGVTP